MVWLRFLQGCLQIFALTMTESCFKIIIYAWCNLFFIIYVAFLCDNHNIKSKKCFLHKYLCIECSIEYLNFFQLAPQICVQMLNLQR
jgi:hypothetical protein